MSFFSLKPFNILYYHNKEKIFKIVKWQNIIWRSIICMIFIWCLQNLPKLYFLVIAVTIFIIIIIIVLIIYSDDISNICI